jgi:FtsP/CotA-like multicopper oxidase with cupredoxin domain
MKNSQRLLVVSLFAASLAAAPHARGQATGQMRATTAAQRKAAADRLKANKAASAPSAPAAVPVPGGTPDYFNYGNWAFSPPLRKFVDTLPGLGAANANNLGQYIPVATPDTSTYPGSDYYQIALVEYAQQMHSDLLPTKLRGYRNLAATGSDAQPHYLGPMIVAQSGRPVRLKFANQLGLGPAGKLFVPVDKTAMGAGTGPDMAHPNELYTENRANLHLHGGLTPWISDGTPHQWITPAGESTIYPKGVSFHNVPDMVGPGKSIPSPAAGDGLATYYYPNQMRSARLLWYHDHSYGITRLNVYTGMAAGYLLTDSIEEDLLVTKKVLPDLGGVYHWGIPLIIQDKTFVPDIAAVNAQDPTWNGGGKGNLWFPHVYMPNQNPGDLMGVAAFGRWDYGPWFWPPMDPTTLVGRPVEIAPGVFAPGTPNPSMVPEAFMDTPLVNGQAYPRLTVGRRAYRFRILNGSNDRTWNLQLYYADPTIAPGQPGYGTEVKMVPAVGHPGDPNWPARWPSDGRDGGVPDPATAGPKMIQIGTEGGFLPAPVVLDNVPINYNYNRRDIVVLNVSDHTLMLGPAERADVIVDFSQVPDGAKIILYNDAPAPVPAFDTRNDYYTGDPDQTDTGGAPSTLPGYGPNTRTIMRFDVSGASADPPFDLAKLNSFWASAYFASQPQPLVPETAYGAATNTYARIQDTQLTFTPSGGGAPVTQPILRKAIQELFELDYGRMNATLGTELSTTNFATQMTVPLGYIDPVTEIIKNGESQLWKITHNGVDTHTIHFHLFNVQVINRVGWDGAVRPPDPNELGWKESVRMNPLEDAIVAMQPVAPTTPFVVPNSVRYLDPTMPPGPSTRFSGIDPYTGNPRTVTNILANFGWEYVWHCHLLGHEENDMMRPIKFVVDSCTIQVVNPAATTATIGTPFSQRFTQTGGSGAVSFTTASALPTGVVLYPDGTLAGWPVQLGTFPIVVQATDANGCSGAGAVYNLVVSCQGITVPSATLVGTQGVPFSQSFVQTGGIGAAVFTTSSPLPAGLSLAPSGLVSGTPTQFGSFPLTLQVEDVNGCESSAPARITINPTVFAVTSVSPNAGTTAGGQAVTVTGQGFGPGITLGIGGAAATAVAVVDANTLTAVTPAHAAGVVDVAAAYPAGATATLAGGYFYAPPPTPTGFFTVAPCRLFDTRTGPDGPALAAGSARAFHVSGRCNVPEDAVSLSVNATITGADGVGPIRVYPGNGISSSAALIDARVGVSRANNALILLATDGTGTVAFRNDMPAGTSTHLILDVNGYFK